MYEESPSRAWVEVDVDAIAHNLEVSRRMAPGVQLMPIVKANAYGHGMEAVARRLDGEDIAFFGVASATEARRLSRSGAATIPFILGPTLPSEREELVYNRWLCTVSSFAEAEHLHQIASFAGMPMRVHIAVDTGMGREGFLHTELGEALPKLAQLEGLQVEGMMSHFSAADEDSAYTRAQIIRFLDSVEEARRHFRMRYVHISASAGLLGYSVPESCLARPGLMLYGVSPMEQLSARGLRPTLRLYSRVTLVRWLPPGCGVSYGHTYVTERRTRVATVGIGYGDGLMRSLAHKGACVYIRGQRCPILGRVTMDQIMVDATDMDYVDVGELVELIGPYQSVQQVAEWAGTIPWEIFTGLSVRLPRIYKRLPRSYKRKPPHSPV